MERDLGPNAVSQHNVKFANLRMSVLVLKFVIFVLLLVALPGLSLAQGLKDQKRPRDLTELSLEELMNIEVTSVSKKEQKISQAAAAIYVITQEDIRRSGATSIPEALRMAPGLDVARIDANKWAISARGFNGFFANKLLVLIDGRSVYTPLFSGVFWDVQDTILEDIERIEVIRGPAGTLWGANAVNGVINIITKHAKDTQGGLVTAGGGNEEQGFGSFRYGGKFNESFFYRLYGKYFNRDNFTGAFGERARDEWHVGRGGFRTDWHVAPETTLHLQGEYYDGQVGTQVTVPSLTSPSFTAKPAGDFPVSGGHLLGQWKHNFSNTADIQFQWYYDRTERASPVHRETRDTFDLEFQHRFDLAERHDFVWGLGYRLTSDRIGATPTIAFNPSSRSDNLFSAFLQDDITLIDQRLRLTIGSKFEHNDYTGVEVQPNIRLLWTPTEQQTVWTAISRAVRTPARFEHFVRANTSIFPAPTAGCPFLCESALFGNRDFKSEDLLAYELGYRAQLGHRLSVDVATFYNVYNNLLSVETGSPFVELIPAPAHLVIPVLSNNKLKGITYGVEIAPTLSVTEHWKLSLGYTFLKMKLRRERSSSDATSKNAKGDSPQNQFHLRSFLDLPYNLNFDAALYYVDSLPHQNVPSYFRFDTRLGWHAFKNFEISVGAQNLFNSKHEEFGPSFLVTPTKIERSVYGKLTWRF